MRIVREKFIETAPSADGLTYEEAESFIYRIVEMSPNADGLYEFGKTQHFTLPPLDAENTLKEAGFRYVGLKKGDAFTELWALDRPSRAKSIHAEEVSDGTAVSPVHLMEIPDNREPKDFGLIKSDHVCYQCGSRIGYQTFEIRDNHEKDKQVVIHICMNPQCSFHYVTVER